MNKWHGILLAALMTTATAATSNEALPESPQDYAYGATLDLPQPASWYRVDLPLTVYAQSVWPDLHDVRVFNHDGERVPFTLETQRAPAREAQDIPLRLFPLAASTDERTDDGQTVVRLRSSSGVDIRIESEREKPVGQSYLLALPETLPADFALATLKLGWSESAANWRSRVTLLASRDMRIWDTVQEEVPVMALASGNDRLKIDQISLEQPLSARSVRYLLMVFDTPNLPVTITQVTAQADSEPTPLEQVQMTAGEKRLSATQAEYYWAHPQPLRALSVQLAAEGVLPVEIAWRSAADAEWQPLSKTVLWGQNGRAAAPLTLAGEPVQAIRLTTLDARLPAQLPQVSGSRDRYSLLFNAQGKGPFTLAWGNRAAQPAAVTLDELIPDALRKQLDLTAIPEVTVQARVELGGDARLTATSPAERQGLWKSLLVWGALLLGVAALVWMALRIWRDVKTQG